MGERELQDALRGETQARIRELWQAAEHVVAEQRAATERELAELHRAAEHRQAAAAAAVRRDVLTAVHARLRQQRLENEARMQQRLRFLAGRLLPALCGADCGRLWQELAAELPSADWRRVRVHPDDLPQARQWFPAAEITTDPALGGGVVAETADARVMVDNSLAGRLEQAWTGLLTPLLAAVDAEVDSDAAGPAAAD